MRFYLVDIIDGKLNSPENRRYPYADTHPHPQVRLFHLNEYTRGALPESALSMPIGTLLGEIIDLAARAMYREEENGFRIEVPLRE